MPTKIPFCSIRPNQVSAGAARNYYKKKCKYSAPAPTGNKKKASGRPAGSVNLYTVNAVAAN
jgi:hypothetical protein